MTDELTHRVAAAAYLFRKDRLLLLKRVAPPQTFAPPGGRLEVGEDPLHGVLREVFEETGLEPEVLGIAQTWFGEYASGVSPLLCINYIAVTNSGDPRLSDEHSESIWVTRDDLESGKVRTQDDSGHGYRTESFLDAFERYHAWVAIK